MPTPKESPIQASLPAAAREAGITLIESCPESKKTTIGQLTMVAF
jgi:hypothetical protein